MTEPALTPRQRDVLTWAARGKTTSETAAILGVTSHVVDYHREQIFARLDCVNIAHAVATAIGLGLIAAPPWQGPASDG